MEHVAFDVEGGHLGVTDLDAFFVCAFVQGARDLQAGFGRRRADQLDDGEPVREWPTAPRLRDVTDMRCSILFHFDVPGG